MKWASAEDTSWPFDLPDDDHDSIEWRLRYASETVTRQEMLSAASVLAAYRHLSEGASPRDSLRRVRAARKAAGWTPPGEERH